MAKPLALLPSCQNITTRSLDIARDEFDLFLRALTPLHALTLDDLMLLDRFHFLHITDRVFPKHHSPLTPHTRADIGDGWELRCDPCGYRNHVSIRADSYFSRAH